ncbi:hypothetical protein SMSP2_01281 [Limihaloglobus sulfuriphilus]|uniref:DUF3955 domain-containing protein n=1 Tax=Limihaloglobus sulfuriphilus TaxID=1851148 RepID=A0A1Q2MEE6_9BACT|nr:hypothetical protein [Limihaloglobus sulfuriphilus]AQQ70918.1 hypothetical protein SMSP2_01281 [Limihaloglobus sulfuriphilus]
MMKIKWANILTAAILIFLVTLGVKLARNVDDISLNIRLPYYLEDPVYGLMFLGLICVTIVAVVKIITKK